MDNTTSMGGLIAVVPLAIPAASDAISARAPRMTATEKLEVRGRIGFAIGTRNQGPGRVGEPEPAATREPAAPKYGGQAFARNMPSADETCRSLLPARSRGAFFFAFELSELFRQCQLIAPLLFDLVSEISTACDLAGLAFVVLFLTA